VLLSEIWQQALEALHLRAGGVSTLAQVPLAFGRFAGQNVAMVRFLMFQAAAGRGLKAFGGAPMGLHFGHDPILAWLCCHLFVILKGETTEGSLLVAQPFQAVPKMLHRLESLYYHDSLLRAK
jgi:hypothetical protein